MNVYFCITLQLILIDESVSDNNNNNNNNDDDDDDDDDDDGDPSAIYKYKCISMPLDHFC